MKKWNILITSALTITLLSGVILPIESTQAATKLTEKKKAALLKELNTDFQKYNTSGNPKLLLEKDTYVISSYNTTQKILTSKERKTFVATYNKLKSNGLTTKNNSTVKSLQKKYSIITNYSEGAKYTAYYRNLVTKYSDSYQKLLTENEYKTLGISNKNDTKKPRGRALKEYTDFKKLVSNNSPKRINSLKSIYSDTTNFALASHAINLGNAQSLTTNESVKKAEGYIETAKKYIPILKDNNAIETINREINNLTTKISNAKNENHVVSEFEKEVVRLVNIEREKIGVAPLKLHTKLSYVSRLKSLDMQTLGYLSHQSPTYGNVGQMLAQFEIYNIAWGENIAQGQTTPAEVMRSWMNSPGHKRNLLNATFTHIGVGHTLPGNYWTQNFIRDTFNS